MSQSKIFIFLGPPGCGKGTLAAQCVQEFGWLQLSTGNLCRDQIQRKTLLGSQIQGLMAQGLLVPDEIIAELVVGWLQSLKIVPSGIIFDGYPRTLAQAQLLYDLWQQKLKNFEIVLVKMNIDVQLLEQRIVNRVTCSNKACGQVYSWLTMSQHARDTMTCDRCGAQLIRRSDDTAEALHQRLAMYFEHEQAILDFLIGKGLSLITLNGAKPKQEVFEKFKTLALL